MFQQGLYLWFYADINCLFYRVTVDGASLSEEAPEAFKLKAPRALEAFNEEMYGGQFDYEIMAKLAWLDSEQDCEELIIKWCLDQDPPVFPKQYYIPLEILDIPSRILNAPNGDDLEELIDSWDEALARRVWRDLPPQAQVVSLNPH